MSKYQYDDDKIDWEKESATVYCWDCGWSGSPRKALNRYVNAFAMCPKCRAVLRIKSLDTHLKETKNVKI